ncbi:class I SAM-dependent methyltransferase [Sphingobacterium sp. ML3W]|uniref:class I SAM-dependent methyltransferase n=1 Tax=Sphingobacterium sp. ML3W TaxID=1538644 RepID=UPI00249A179C|nr:class I SAM-dependent methyltransferase [Sphingobacterium sp. ML3W]WFA81625.1 class I SAM-dependent methyltransferase [Sphingobacterium sp. ML3W]
MQENKYDDPKFFEEYSKMYRSQKGLLGAGEWHEFQKLLPNLKNSTVLDLGCGYGWHCRYVIENGAKSVIGVDLSEKMLEKANEINKLEGIEYQRNAIEELTFRSGQFNLVISSLAFHYIKDFDMLCRNIYNWLQPGGKFLFSIEHPVFTAQGNQDWIYNKDGDKLYWPVDNYFLMGARETTFLGNTVLKYHRTITSYLRSIVQSGFKINACVEPEPSTEMLENFPAMGDELRRPMMLIISAEK